jgi:hypothetical protein
VQELSKHYANSFEELADMISSKANEQVDRIDEFQLAQTIAEMDESYE